MAQRGGDISGFFDGFGASYGTVRRVMQDKELKDLAKAMPEQSEGFTAEQGDQLRAAAESGQYDVAYDADKGGYTVTPKADPTQTGVIARQGVTDFLGNRTAGAMSDGQVNSARNMAMAGVLKKYGDPIGGMRMEQQARQGERDDQRFTWEQGRAKREEDAAQLEDSWRTGREQLLQDSNFGQVQRENSEAQKNYEASLANYKQRTDAGEQGVPEPQPPQMRNYGVGQAMLDNLSFAAHDVQYGKANPEALTKLAKMRKDLEDEGYSKALRLAQGGSAIDQVMAAYNEGGKDKIKPEDLISDRMVDRGNGVKSRVLTFRGPDGKPVTIDALGELDALGQADKVYDRVFRKNAETRAQSAEGRAAEAHSTNMQDRKEKKESGAALFQEQNPGATKAQLRAVQAGVVPPTQGNKDYKLEMNEVATAFGTPAVDAQGKPIMDLMTGRQVVNRDKSAEDAFFAWMKKNGITDTNKGLLEYKAQPAPGGAPSQSFTSPAEVEAAAKAGKIKRGDRVIVNGRAATWQ